MRSRLVQTLLVLATFGVTATLVCGLAGAFNPIFWTIAIYAFLGALGCVALATVAVLTLIPSIWRSKP